MKVLTEKGVVGHVIRPAKVHPARLLWARYAQQPIINHKLWMIPWKMNEWRERRRLGKKSVVVLIYILIE